MSTDLTDNLSQPRMGSDISDNPSGQQIQNRVYDQYERAAIDVFKNEYLEATTPAARKMLAQLKIFPALFNYWESIGVIINEEKRKLLSKELLSWLRNTWRPEKKAHLEKPKQYRLTDVLWWKNPDDVMKEVASIMGLESADTNTPGWFENRTTAAKNILNVMTEAQKNRLRDEADEMAAKGLPEEVQRKLAEDKWKSHFSKTAKENYNEMGLVSISVVAFIRKNGQLAINIHDDIAQVMGVPCKSFHETYEKKVDEFMRTVMEYVKTVRAAARSGSGSGSEPGQTSVTVEVDSDGYPIAPCPTSWDKVTKDDLERLYRLYITQHYRLATGVRDRQAPFTRIAKKQSNFIQSKYIPRGITLDDPRAMKREAIIKFFQHIATREASHGVPNAFRFKAVLSSRKKGDLCETSYADNQERPRVPDMTQESGMTPTLAIQPEPAFTPGTYIRPALAGILDPAFARGQVPTPAMTPEPTLAPLGTDPATNPSRMSQRVRDKSRAHSGQMNQDQYTFNSTQPNFTASPDSENNWTPTLSLDPAFAVDPLIILDPGLDFHSNTALQSLSGEIYLPWPNTTSSSSATPATTSTNNPVPDLAQSAIDPYNPYPEPSALHPFDSLVTSSQDKRSPRRKAKNAQALAIEEAKQFAVRRKSRR